MKTILPLSDFCDYANCDDIYMKAFEWNMGERVSLEYIDWEENTKEFCLLSIKFSFFKNV